MTDSASHIAYKLRNFADSYFPEKTISIMPLNEALPRKFDAYVFYDDNVNSGLQSLNILSAWLNISLSKELLLPEEHVQPLERGLQEELRSKPTGFTFAIGTEGAKERLIAQFVELLKFNRSKIAFEVSKSLPQSKKVFAGTESPFQHKDKLRLRDYLKDVTKEIMIAEGKKPEAAESRTLGYGGAEAMVVFPYNCPTMTVTGLWVSGKYAGGEWLPLVERGRRTEPGSSTLSGEDA